MLLRDFQGYIKIRQHMAYTGSAHDHLARAETLRKAGDQRSLLYAALELRLGIEARLKEYLEVATDIPQSARKLWEIAKLGKLLEAKYGLAGGTKIIFVTLNSQRASFMYTPVSDRLQQIGGALGNYLHWKQVSEIDEESHWRNLAALLHEGCGHLQLACAGEVLRPSFSDGLHFVLDTTDPRVDIVRALEAGAAASFEVFDFTPAGPLTYYSADAA